MITLIGLRCTHSNVFSRELLIDQNIPYKIKLLFERSGASTITKANPALILLLFGKLIW